MTDSNHNWEAVPVLVQDLYIKYAYAARKLAAGEPNHVLGWMLDTEEVGPVLVKVAAELPTVDTAPDMSSFYEGKPFFPQAGKAWRTAQSYMGGPNPTTAMLLGGALAGGAGYAGGALMHKLFPQWFEEHSKKSLGMVGALGGAGLAGLVHAYPALKHYGPKGMLIQQPLQGGPAYPKTASEHLVDLTLQRAEADYGLKPAPDQFDKQADGSVSGGYLLDIPTDEWGRVVMRDPYLEAQEKALAAGLPAAAGAMRGSRMVSPRDVASVAMNAGLGYGYGYLGSIAAKFMGLSPPLQKGIQQAGLLAGAVRGVTGML